MTQLGFSDLADRIERRYESYLRERFHIRDPRLRKSLNEAVTCGALFRGPFLEASGSFTRGGLCSAVIEEAIGLNLKPGFREAIQGARYLYKHQEDAIRHVIQSGRSVVIATGTGSGKTEAFFLPILSRLYEEHVNGTLSEEGIRALVVYPMNALANDQRERLGAIAQVLEDTDSDFRFTFGQYIGETPIDASDSWREPEDKLEGKLPGELVFRSDMWQNPPHILLTNFSMLEYLLIRPHDSRLFDDGRSAWWRFIVLDEAHQYAGTLGNEIGMLMRRLKARIRAGGCSGGVCCIATSATLAGGSRDAPEVAAFASTLFGEEIIPDDIITSDDTKGVPEERVTLEPSDYSLAAAAVESGDPSSLLELAEQHAIPVGREESVAAILGAILSQDSRSCGVRRRLLAGPRTCMGLADDVFADCPEADRLHNLELLVSLLVRAEDPTEGAALLAARYHHFIRALEGAFLVRDRTSGNWGVSIARRASDKTASFELALCKECGQHYLVGQRVDGKLVEAIGDPGDPDFGAEFFLPLGRYAEGEVDEHPQSEGAVFVVCGECGSMMSYSEAAGHECGEDPLLVVQLVPPATTSADRAKECTACGYSGADPLQVVRPGRDGPHAVIATALCERLPERRRRILAFADSRRSAARFAWFLEDSQRAISERSTILRAARDLAAVAGAASLADLARRVGALMQEARLVPESASDLSAQQAGWRAVYREFLTDEQRISLSGLGLVTWRPRLPASLSLPELLFDEPWTLSAEHVEELLCVLLETMREENSVELRSPDAIGLTWQELDLQRPQTSTRIGTSIRSRRGRGEIRSWDTNRGRRAGLLAKFLVGKGVDEVEARELAVDALRAIWEALTVETGGLSSREGLLVPLTDSRRLNPDWWRLVAHPAGSSIWRCDTCGRVQHFDLGGTCVRHGCNGSTQFVEQDTLQDNHYSQLYQRFPMLDLRVEEHTAQIDSKQARSYQEDFKSGGIDVLSCSTTFELGVDLGELDIVFLRNVPPQPFNYAQRVGRTGRRLGHPGFAVTYCGRTPHDLYHFAEPESRILLGDTKPPTIQLLNQKIAIRHMTAIALGRFFRDTSDAFESVSGLVVDMANPQAVERISGFLERESTRVEKVLLGIVPEELRASLGLLDGTWIPLVVGPDSALAQAEAEISSDYQCAVELREKAKREDDFGTAGWAKRRIHTLSRESTLSFLSRKGVIPKYGFPVDVVELDLQHGGTTTEGATVSLQRDLGIAISEFAPSNRIVANKLEWQSVGVKRVLGKEWPQKEYVRCPRHGAFASWNLGAEERRLTCCSHLIRGVYLQPRFGFTVGTKRPTRPTGRFRNLLSTRPYFEQLLTAPPGEVELEGLSVTRAAPGRMVRLCEGHRGMGFFVCGQCGAGFVSRVSNHETPYGEPCKGTLSRVSLGHEFDTDVVLLRFTRAPGGGDIGTTEFSQSLAYALLEGAASTIGVPSTDLNVTVTFREDAPVQPIVLYDDVPGGAGLVARLADREILVQVLKAAVERVSGKCGCGHDSSCYGCLRSYRNQFAHRYLNRGAVLQYLESVLARIE